MAKCKTVIAKKVIIINVKSDTNHVSINSLIVPLYWKKKLATNCISYQPKLPKKG
jgi:hypothetical protein